MNDQAVDGTSFTGSGARRGLKRAVVAGLLLPLSFALSTWAAPAARPALTTAPTFTVNTPSDVVAAGPLDDGHCATFYNSGVPNGVCTLRAAIMKANHWPGGGAIIVLPALAPGGEYVLTIPQSGPDDETTGDLNITATMTIRGGGSSNTIIYDNSGLTNDRVFSIGAGVAVSLTGVTIRGGAAAGGGGISNAGALTLDRSTVISNTATTTSSGDGGGILNSSSLTVTNSLISGNHAELYGGGIFSTSDMSVYSSTIVGNHGLYAGGVDASGNSTLAATTVSANTSDTSGGGLVNANGTENLISSTVSANTAGVSGGGLVNANGTVNLVNSTVSGNFADIDGAGIYNGCLFCDSVVKLFNVTISNNQADANYDGTGTGGGVYNTADAGSTVDLQNSLLYGNWQTALMSIRVLNDCIGTLTSLDYNLVGYTNGCTFNSSTHDQTNVAADLGPLQDNGGPTWTHALLPGSPAIDAGNSGGCTDNNGAILASDQRGYPRTANGAGTTRCDIGAYELQRIVNLPLVRH